MTTRPVVVLLFQPHPSYLYAALQEGRVNPFEAVPTNRTCSVRLASASSLDCACAVVNFASVCLQLDDIGLMKLVAAYWQEYLGECGQLAN